MYICIYCIYCIQVGSIYTKPLYTALYRLHSECMYFIEKQIREASKRSNSIYEDGATRRVRARPPTRTAFMLFVFMRVFRATYY